MKSITALILAALCATVMCDRQSDWQANADKCSQQYKVSTTDLYRALKGDIKPANVTQNQKCMFLCMAESEGFMKGGNLQVQALPKLLANAPNKDLNALRKAVATCKDVKGANDCDTAYKVMTCLVANKAM